MISKPFSILFAHNQYGRKSGEEHAIEEIIRILKQGGHQVDTFFKSSENIKGLSGEAKAFFSGIYNPFSKREMARRLAEKSYDLVQAQNLYPFLSPAVLGEVKKQNLPLLMRCPNYRLFCPNGLHLCRSQVCEKCLGFGKELWCLLRNCEENLPKSAGYALRNAVARITGSILGNVDIFIVLSEFQKKRFMENGVEEERLEILPNITPAVDDKYRGPLGDLVTFCGRISEEKGISEFLEAARALPDIPFALAGRFEEDSPWKKNSPANVDWLGFLNDEEMNQLYSRSRMLVFPSKWFEGFPNVITRAMVLERPVIASNIGALPEIVVYNETGLLFDPGDSEDLVKKIKALYGKPDICEAMGKAGREKAQREYSESAVYDRLMTIYDRAIQSVQRKQ